MTSDAPTRAYPCQFRILLPQSEPLEQTMYLGEFLFDLAAPSVRCSGQVPRFLGEKFFALKQRGACYVGRR